MKKIKGFKVNAYDTGIRYADPDGYIKDRNYILYVVDDPASDCYDYLLGVRGIGHLTDMFGLMKSEGYDYCLEVAEANLLDRNCMCDVFNTELEQKELVGEIQTIWDYRRRGGCPQCDEE